jgi:hypothetical protein
LAEGFTVPSPAFCPITVSISALDNSVQGSGALLSWARAVFWTHHARIAMIKKTSVTGVCLIFSSPMVDGIDIEKRIGFHAA